MAPIIRRCIKFQICGRVTQKSPSDKNEAIKKGLKVKVVYLKIMKNIKMEVVCLSKLPLKKNAENFRKSLKAFKRDLRPIEQDLEDQLEKCSQISVK